MDRFQSFTVLITRINRSIHKIKAAEMAEFQLKSAHVSCLYYLYKESGLTAKELADICEEDKASISRSLEYLEEQGYISCASSAKKRYKATLFLTESGRELGARISEKIDGVLDPAGMGIDEADRATMYESLAIISENLERICEKYGG